jgi:lambda family phage tail tape measure protein
MSAIENFILRFKVEGKNEVDNVRGSVSGLRDDINDLAQVGGPLGNTINGLVSQLGKLGPVAVLAGLAFGKMYLESVRLAAQLSDIAGASGISEGALMSLRTSVIEAGGSMDDFSTLATKLNQSVNEAAAGNDKLIKAFNDLGVYILDADGKLRSTEDILIDITAQFQKGEITASQYAAAFDILGKSIGRLDLLKIKAVGDTDLTKQIQALDRLAEMWDKFKDAVERNMVAAFGNLTLALEGGFITSLNYAIRQLNKLVGTVLNLPTDTVAKLFNIQNPVGLGDIFLRTAENMTAPTGQANATVTTAPNRPGVSNPVGEAAIAKAKADAEKAAKEAADLELRIFKSKENAKRDTLLQFATDEEQAAEIRAQSQIREAQRTITNAKELSARIVEIETARDLEVGKIQARAQEKAAAEEKRLTDRRLAEIERLNTAAQTEIRRYGGQTNLLKEQLALQQELVGLSTIEGDRRTKIAEAARDQAAMLASLVGITDNDMRLKREQEINDAHKERIALINQEADVRAKREQNFAAGVQETMKKYAESLTPLKQGAAMAESVYGNMGRSLDNFVETGKFKFSDFASSVIMDLLKIQLRAAATQLFNSVLGTFGFSLPGRANGGPVTAGQPYIVGERGPEVFLPAGNGMIVPNNRLSGSGGDQPLGGSTTIINNISAIDAKSVAQLFSENRMTLFGTVEQARRELPMRTR